MFWIGVILAACLHFGVYFWSLRAQSQYLRLCRERGVSDLPLPEELSQRVLNSGREMPARFLGFMGQGFALLDRRQEDPVLEGARRRAKFRGRISRLTIIPASIIILVAVVADQYLLR